MDVKKGTWCTRWEQTIATTTKGEVQKWLKKGLRGGREINKDLESDVPFSKYLVWRKTEE